MIRRQSFPSFSELRAAAMAGRIMRSCPLLSSGMMRTRSWRRSRRRSGWGHPRPISAARWPTRRRCALLVSAPRTSMPTGETALHLFTYANAIHQALKRTAADDVQQNDGIDAARGVLHGAMAVYLAPYLNVPPARLPGEGGDRLNDLPDKIEEIRAALLSAFDRQRQVDTA